MVVLPEFITNKADRVRRAFIQAPSLCYGLIFLVILELAGTVIAPLFVSDSTYLALFLPQKSKQSISNLENGVDPYFVYDSVVGWKNRPNANFKQWVTDSIGSRSTHKILIRSDRSQRVLFLGNSVINGGDRVNASETISAYIEDSTTESLNFATMLYSLDQAYLSYHSELYRYHPNVIVVGLQGDAGRLLTNRFVPFAKREEINIPFFKPRFIAIDTGLTELPVYPLNAYKLLAHSSDLVDSLLATDNFSADFRAWEHFGQTPVSNYLWKTFKRIGYAATEMRGDVVSLDLTLAIMRKFVETASTYGTKVIFVMLPDRTQTFVSKSRKLLPDTYQIVFEKFRSEGFQILDCRAFLRASELRGGDLYFEDGVHFTASGNLIIARALKSLLAGDEHTRPNL